MNNRHVEVNCTNPLRRGLLRNALLCLAMAVLPVSDPSLAATPGHENQGTVTIEGPAAASATLVLPRAANVSMSIAYYYAGHDRESATLFVGRNDLGDEFFCASSVSQSEFGEVHFQVGPWSVGHVVVPPFASNGGQETCGDFLAPGTWYLRFLGNASQPVATTVFGLTVDDEDASWTWSITRETELVTVRNMRPDAKVFARGIPGGASVVAGGTHAVSVEGKMFGFSMYFPGAADRHEFSMVTPWATLPADELWFFGWPAGEYAFRLEQISAGKWPGRMVLLVADFPEAWG